MDWWVGAPVENAVVRWCRVLDSASALSPNWFLRFNYVFGSFVYMYVCTLEEGFRSHYRYL